MTIGSKLTVVSKVYRGVSGRVLPKEFWEPNEYNVCGGVEPSFMSTTVPTLWLEPSPAAWH